MEGTIDLKSKDHIKKVPTGKPHFVAEEKAASIERENNILFNKIEQIMYRKGPYKKQQSKSNAGKLTKIYHAPSDSSIQPGTYIEQPSYSLKKVLKDQRTDKINEIHAENQKILGRIVNQKPSINNDELRKWEKYQKKLHKNRNNQMSQTKHGYVARGSENVGLFKTDRGSLSQVSKNVTPKNF